MLNYFDNGVPNIIHRVIIIYCYNYHPRQNTKPPTIFTWVFKTTVAVVEIVF